MTIKLKPLGDRLIVRAIEGEETTEGGIVVPDTAKEKPQKGKVLAVGLGNVDEETGKRTRLDVEVGDEVLYAKYHGTEIKVEGEELLVLREADVIAAVGSTKASERIPHSSDTRGPAAHPDVPRLRREVAEDINRLFELAE